MRKSSHPEFYPFRLGSGGEALLHRPARGPSPVGRADLRVDVLDVPISGPRRDEESLGDLPGGECLCCQPEHLDLAGTQPAGPCTAGRGLLTEFDPRSMDLLSG